MISASPEGVARHELLPRGAGLKLDPLDLHGAHARAAPPPPISIRYDWLSSAWASILSSSFARSAPLRLAIGATSPAASSCSASATRPRTPTVRSAMLLASGIVAADAVERILEARHQPRTLDEYVADETARRIDTLLGAVRTEPRDLGEYERLPLTTRSFGPQEPPSAPKLSLTIYRPLHPSAAIRCPRTRSRHRPRSHAARGGERAKSKLNRSAPRGLVDDLT
jgi:hypothetical protein